MTTLACYIFTQFGFNVHEISKFIFSIRRGYLNVSYHNFEHAFNVLHCIYCILIRNRDIFTRLEVCLEISKILTQQKLLILYRFFFLVCNMMIKHFTNNDFFTANCITNSSHWTWFESSWFYKFIPRGYSQSICVSLW